MEQTARDHLVAPSLIASPDVADAVLEARNRGVTVILSAEDAAEPDAGRLPAFQRLVVEALRDASVRGVIRARCAPATAASGRSWWALVAARRQPSGGAPETGPTPAATWNRAGTTTACSSSSSTQVDQPDRPGSGSLSHRIAQLRPDRPGAGS
jgi:hypothetical protein